MIRLSFWMLSYRRRLGSVTTNQPRIWQIPSSSYFPGCLRKKVDKGENQDTAVSKFQCSFASQYGGGSNRGGATYMSTEKLMVAWTELLGNNLVLGGLCWDRTTPGLNRCIAATGPGAHQIDAAFKKLWLLSASGLYGRTFDWAQRLLAVKAWEPAGAFSSVCKRAFIQLEVCGGEKFRSKVKEGHGWSRYCVTNVERGSSSAFCVCGTWICPGLWAGWNGYHALRYHVNVIQEVTDQRKAAAFCFLLCWKNVWGASNGCSIKAKIGKPETIGQKWIMMMGRGARGWCAFKMKLFED